MTNDNKNMNDDEVMEKVRKSLEDLGMKDIQMIKVSDLIKVSDSPSIQPEQPKELPPELKNLQSARDKALAFERSLPMQEVMAAKKSFNDFLKKVYHRGLFEGAMYGSVLTAILFSSVAFVMRYYVR